MLNKIFILCLYLFFVSGCSTLEIKPYDRTGFNINPNQKLVLYSKPKFGLVKMGHSDWISTEDYANGKSPQYYCRRPGPHTWGGGYWIFDKKDQEKIIKNINSIFISNNIYDNNAKNILLVNFINVKQGPNDSPVYNFEIEVSYLENGDIVYTKNHQIEGNQMSEEFWTLDGWGGAKKRASYRVVYHIVSDFTDWLNKRNI